MSFLRNCWQVVAYGREVIAGRIMTRRIANEPLILFRTARGKLVAMEDRCPHRSAPLSKGTLLGEQIRCGYHGLKFDADGKCTQIPGQNLIPPKARARIYPVVERYTFAWIWMGEAQKADAALIPDVRWMSSPEWITSDGYHKILANYKLLNDNLLDLSHESYVHVHTIGNDAVADTPVVVKSDDKAVYVVKEIDRCNPPPLYQYLGRVPANADVKRWQRTTYMPPGYCVIDVGIEAIGDVPGAVRVEGRVINLMTPETDSTSHYFWGFARNFRLEEPEVTEFLRENVRRTFDEDKDMLEAQQANLGSGDFDPAYKVAVKADAGAVAGRRLLASFIEAEARAVAA